MLNVDQEKKAFANKSVSLTQKVLAEASSLPLMEASKEELPIFSSEILRSVIQASFEAGYALAVAEYLSLSNSTDHFFNAYKKHHPNWSQSLSKEALNCVVSKTFLDKGWADSFYS